METMREKTLRQANKEIYWAWKSMKQRTQNPKCSAYKNYGARGIQVCNKWQKFEPFCEWAWIHDSGAPLHPYIPYYNRRLC